MEKKNTDFWGEVLMEWAEPDPKWKTEESAL